jgi:hypothetical protein
MIASEQSQMLLKVKACCIISLALISRELLATSYEERFSLTLPVDCTIGVECFIQNYYDHGKNGNFQDYKCGFLSYPNHRGTDFRVPHLSPLTTRTKVLAAAKGIVLATRDGEPDLPISIRGKDKTAGKEAGNSVLIDHGDGWMTQYSHLKQNSIQVKQGQSVSQGEFLGLIGISGNAEFPHVDFSVRYNGEKIDPFFPYKKEVSCNDMAATNSNLWNESARTILSYAPTGVLQAGFSNSIQSRIEVESSDKTIPANIIAVGPLVYWVQLYGLQNNDQWEIKLWGNNPNKPLVVYSQVISGNKAVYIAAAGKKNAGTRWPTGIYTGEFKLKRNGKTIVKKNKSIEL